MGSGIGALANGQDAVAIGASASATATDSVAIGRQAAATHANAAAIGANAATTRDNQMMFGTVANTYTAPGITSAASAAAQTGPVQVVTSDASGNLATDGGALFAAAAAIPGLRRDVDRNREGVAMAMALDVPYVPPSETFALGGGLGFFDGSSAFALSGAVRISPSAQLDAGLAYGFDRDTLGGRVGMTFSW